MSFDQSVKREILDKSPKEKHCKIAFLAGLIRGSGEIYYENEQLGLQFRLFSEELLVYVGNILKSLFNYEIREISFYQDKLNKKDNFLVSISGERAREILNELEILVQNDDEINVNLKFYGKLTQKECCLRSFIKGLYLSSGKCTIPKKGSTTKTGYHLEIAFSHYTPALETAEKLEKFGVISKITRRKDKFILYIKSADEIKNFFAFLPAPVSVLNLTDFMIERGLSNNSNRQKNCDLGNVNRQVEASSKQLEAIIKIENTIGLNALKPDLFVTAIARKENAEDSLLELAQNLNITKSCLNHRLRKIIEIAKSL